MEVRAMECSLSSCCASQQVDLHTCSLKMSQYDHTTQTYTKKPLSQRWHVLGDGSGVVQRDIYSAFLARCVMGNTHHLSHLETMWAAQKPVLLQTGWLRMLPVRALVSARTGSNEPAKIEPSYKPQARQCSEAKRLRGQDHGVCSTGHANLSGDTVRAGCL